MANTITNHGSYDYIIVGAGSSGCLLANRLTQNPDVTVLLLEAGSKDDYVWIHVPVGYLYCIDNPRTDWQFKTTENVNLNGRQLLYPRGKTLGGSSSINGMIYMRGQAADFDLWSSLTNDSAWSWDQVLPRYKSFEDYHGGANDWHGAGGEWSVSKQRLKWDILESFKEATIQAGIPETSDFNRGDNFGVGFFDVNQKNGWRLNTAKAFLKKASLRSNLTIITGAHVDRLVFDVNKKCIGVNFYGNNTAHCAQVNSEALLSAGSIGSVQILERSGIGQKKHLQDLGIPVVHDSPGVGENLQDHLQLRMIYKVSNISTLNTKVNSLFGKAKIGLEYLLRRTGPMSMAPSQLGAFAKTAFQTRANVQYHVQPLSLERFGENLHPFNAFTASVCNLQPSSVGSVHISSADFMASPLINPNYLSTITDRKVAVESIELTRKIISQPALSQFCPMEYKPGAHLLSEEDLVIAAGDIGTTIFHPVGTCKMGLESDPLAVVDSELRVFGVRGLRIVDASVMPKITSGNTAAPTMMIAQRVADILKSR
jgi:choline dehydrogenase